MLVLTSREVDIEHVGESGYGDDFLEPPYPITLQPRAAQDLFFAIDGNAP